MSLYPDEKIDAFMKLPDAPVHVEDRRRIWVEDEDEEEKHSLSRNDLVEYIFWLEAKLVEARDAGSARR